MVSAGFVASVVASVCFGACVVDSVCFGACVVDSVCFVVSSTALIVSTCVVAVGVSFTVSTALLVSGSTLALVVSFAISLASGPLTVSIFTLEGEETVSSDLLGSFTVSALDFVSVGFVSSIALMVSASVFVSGTVSVFCFVVSVCPLSFVVVSAGLVDPFVVSGTLISTSLPAGVSLFSAAGDLMVFASSLALGVGALSEFFFAAVVVSAFAVVSLLLAVV